ncbi:MAG: signal peptidase I [Candidatus Aenigmarchaeota archaeon]|nr:signal peptidase I [Candidatus Aenigmarchaeota archaeon]
MNKLTKDIVEFVIFVALAWIFYQVLAMAVNTPMPLVSVVSESMEPVLHRGDLLFVTGGNYSVRDVVIYQRYDVDYTIVHRIIEEDENGLTIKGDNNPMPDPGYVERSQILGKVRFAMPMLGYPRLALHWVGI